MTKACRFLPNSFDPDDPDMNGIPVPLDWRWNSVEHTFKTWGVRGVMMRLPLFWQLEVPLFHACQNAGAFLFANDIGNMPLGAVAMRIAEIDTVVTNLEDACTFVPYLLEHGAPLPRHWVIVRNQENAHHPLPSAMAKLSVYEEVHSSPGIIAKQHI